MSKKQPSTIPVPPTAANPAVELPTMNLPEAPMPTPVVTVSASIPQAITPQAPPVVPEEPVTPENQMQVHLPEPEAYVMVEALREGFVKNSRKLKGSVFPWPASRKLGSWMKLAQ